MIDSKILVDHETVNQILSLSGPTILALENESVKAVFVTFSEYPLEVLGRHLSKIQRNRHQYELSMKSKLSIKILETNSSRERFNFYVSQYRNEGWQVLHSKAKLAVVYKLDTKFNKSYQSMNVVLKDRNKHELVVGVFKTKQRMDDFIRNNYPDINQVTKVIYSRNKESLRYYEEMEIVVENDSYAYEDDTNE